MARPKTILGETKNLHVHLPKDLFMYVKKSAMMADCSMATIVIHALEGQRKKVMDGLTDNITNV